MTRPPLERRPKWFLRTQSKTRDQKPPNDRSFSLLERSLLLKGPIFAAKTFKRSFLSASFLLRERSLQEKKKERKGKRVLGPAQSTPSGDRRARGGCGGAMPGEAGSKGGGLFKGTVRWDHLTKNRGECSQASYLLPLKPLSLSLSRLLLTVTAINAAVIISFMVITLKQMALAEYLEREREIWWHYAFNPNQYGGLIFTVTLMWVWNEQYSSETLAGFLAWLSQVRIVDDYHIHFSTKKIKVHIFLYITTYLQIWS